VFSPDNFGVVQLYTNIIIIIEFTGINCCDFVNSEERGIIHEEVSIEIPRSSECQIDAVFYGKTKDEMI
jgi:hypothetical protein